MYHEVIWFVCVRGAVQCAPFHAILPNELNAHDCIIIVILGIDAARRHGHL